MMSMKTGLLLLLLATAPASGATGRVVDWAELLAAAEPGAVAHIDGRDVTISGFIVPVDREGDVVHEFLLVPWVGACSHVAQPLPSQVIRVTPSAPFRAAGSYEAVSISGRLKAAHETTQLFIMDGVTTITSAYAVGKATVRRTGSDSPARLANPWRLLQR